MNLNMPVLEKFVDGQPHPLLFATISGAHLYGFPSPDSDFDIRGVHVLPPREVIGLTVRTETIDRMQTVDGMEMDIVTHDALMFFQLMLTKNGAVLEQLYSPLVVKGSPWFEELKSIGHSCVTKFHAYHYLGFSKTQWKLFKKESPRRVKPLLYVYRVLLTGIHLMRTGQIEANVVTLNADFKLPYIDDLVARKLASPEQATLDDSQFDFHQKEFDRLTALLEGAMEVSDLPEAPSTTAALNDLLVRIRMGRQ